MVDKKNFVEKTFISYLDDDSSQKNQWVVILKENSLGVEFKFENNLDSTIFIPWSRVLKLKRKGGEDGKG